MAPGRIDVARPGAEARDIFRQGHVGGEVGETPGQAPALDRHHDQGCGNDGQDESNDNRPDGGDEIVSNDKELLQGIKLSNLLRQAAAVEELYYSPSLRETIAFGKLLDAGLKPRQAADIVFANVYSQWGNVEYQKVSDIIMSMFGN